VPTPLLNRIAVVTGSSQGIGAGIAMEIAHAGADVCINYVGDAAPALKLAEQIRAIGRRAIVVEADVSNRDAIERMFDTTEKELGPVEILVTNAVTSKRSNILETKVEDFERTLKIGLFGVFHCFQIFSQRMVLRGQRGGSIIHIGSPHAKGPFKDAIDYNVTKAGANHLALSAANELMWCGIRVNIVQPGWTYTEGELTLYSEEVLAKSASQMPLGRLSMPEDIGKAVVWLCSDEAAYVTGANLTVDGGQFIETAPSWTSKGRHQ
jgi:NAD(P)-dependent dehydrogenase (short-subunit alcohol dehydrogenase family)